MNFKKLDTHLRNSVTSEQQVDSSTAPIQLQLDPNPKSTELQPQQSIQASCDRPNLTSAYPYESPTLKLLPP